MGELNKLQAQQRKPEVDIYAFRSTLDFLCWLPDQCSTPSDASSDGIDDMTQSFSSQLGLSDDDLDPTVCSECDEKDKMLKKCTDVIKALKTALDNRDEDIAHLHFSEQQQRTQVEVLSRRFDQDLKLINRQKHSLEVHYAQLQVSWLRSRILA
mgnify:CR=1 FL=1